MSLALMTDVAPTPPPEQAAERPAERVTWALYRSAHGSPAPFLVVRWRATPGQTRAICDEPVYAASLEQARGVVPRGLVKSAPRKLSKTDRLVEIWKEPRE